MLSTSTRLFAKLKVKASETRHVRGCHRHPRRADINLDMFNKINMIFHTVEKLP